MGCVLLVFTGHLCLLISLWEHSERAAGSVSPGLEERKKWRKPKPFLRSWTRTSRRRPFDRSEGHTSELQSLMRISYAVFCLKKKKTNPQRINPYSQTTKHITINI